MRKYAGGPFVTRGTKNDYRVPGTDIVIEKGLDVIIPIHAIHHDPGKQINFFGVFTNSKYNICMQKYVCNTHCVYTQIYQND